MMCLILTSRRQEFELLLFDTIPLRSLINLFLFWGFAHIWLGGCKKEVKHRFLKRNAFAIIIAGTSILAVATELLLYYSGFQRSICSWSIVFNLIGMGFGILTFKLVYRSCY